MSASNMTPGEIVSELDKYIVGQDRAKRAPSPSRCATAGAASR